MFITRSAIDNQIVEYHIIHVNAVVFQPQVVRININIDKLYWNSCLNTVIHVIFVHKIYILYHRIWMWIWVFPVSFIFIQINFQSKSGEMTVIPVNINTSLTRHNFICKIIILSCHTNNRILCFNCLTKSFCIICRSVSNSTKLFWCDIIGATISAWLYIRYINS